MRTIVEEDERTFSPNNMPLSPRLSIVPGRSQLMAWSNPSVLAQKSKSQDDSLDIAQTLKEAKAKFAEMDKNANGTLEGNELLTLADWCWSHFRVGGRELTNSDKKKWATDLLSRTDTNQDGKIDFDEFAEWFVRTVNRVKREKRQRALSSQYEISDTSDDGKDAQTPSRSTPRSPASFSLNKHRKNRTEPMTPARRAINGQNPYRSQYGQRSMMHSTSPKKQPPKAIATVQVRHQFSSPHSKSPFKQSRSPVKQKTSPKTPLKKNIIRRQNTGESEPWMALANFKQPAKNRVQLFLRLNTNRDNRLGIAEVKPLLIKCGVPSHQLEGMVDKFCEHFGSNSRQITFKQFEEHLGADANERTIYKIVQDLLTIE